MGLVTKVRLFSVALAMASPGACIAQTGAMAALPPEEITTAVMPPASPARLYLPDISTHLVDTRVIVIDGETMRYLATIPSGLVGLFTANPQKKEVYVATTYYSRGTRGERTDVLEIFDDQTLERKGEMILPPERAQALNYEPYFRPASDGNYVFLQNLSPASSVVVIDPAKRQILATAETSGCAGIYPSPTTPLRFSTLCGDGTVVTITLDEAGRVLTRNRSKKFFAADKDPLFISNARNMSTSLFVSFQGILHEIDFSGPTATQRKPWSLVPTEDAGWRPGGYQLIAVNRAANQLYVGMHANGREGSHKQPADEIWQIDLGSKQRVARIPGNKAVALGVTPTANPMLFVLNGTNGELVRLDVGDPGKPGETISSVVEAPAIVLTQ
jgi:methylamine dehydrogenase heavy chain